MKKENLYTINCIRTFTGKYIDPLNPDPDLICIEDIAHALSMKTRFGGHLHLFYTVAQHSCWCALNIKNQEHAFAALLHDSTEAYFADLPSPLKKRLPDYAAAEENLMMVIAKKFGIQYPFVPEIKEIDKQALVWEWENIMIADPSEVKVITFAPHTTEQTFLNLFHSLT